MQKLACAIALMLPVVSSALAQSSAAEESADRVGPLGIVIFLVLFIVICAAMVAPIWLKKTKDGDEPGK